MQPQQQSLEPRYLKALFPPRKDFGIRKLQIKMAELRAEQLNNYIGVAAHAARFPPAKSQRMFKMPRTRRRDRPDGIFHNSRGASALNRRIANANTPSALHAKSPLQNGKRATWELRTLHPFRARLPRKPPPTRQKPLHWKCGLRAGSALCLQKREEQPRYVPALHIGLHSVFLQGLGGCRAY